MADAYVFSDEAGNFDFSRGPSASRYFILCTISLSNCVVGDELLELRRKLGWQGIHLDSVFHASEDPQRVRNEVFSLLQAADFRIDATVFEKSKARPYLQSDRALYKIAWFLHFKHVAPQIVSRQDRLFVVASSLGTKKRRGTFHDAVDNVVRQVSPCHRYRVAFWPAASDPCLQVADYCTWAIQRKWERQDTRSYDLIKDKVATEYDVWASGPQHFY